LPAPDEAAASGPAANSSDQPGQPIDLRGKTALVTGSARRVGRAIALELARQGMNLVIHHAHSEQDAETAALEVRALGVTAVVAQADLTKPEAIATLFDTVWAKCGRLDVLVNSAASFERGDIRSLSLAQWQQALDLNLTAPMLCSQHAARLMLEHGGGAIINILDLSAFKPWTAFPAHSVSKAALRALTLLLAKSLAPHIRVNALALGPVLRDEGSSPQQWAKIGQRLPVGHTGSPADVARAAAFLAAQPFITGAVLRVDGGESLL
jgi:NAD(P)-dependent dehydrogenase (short-subunit alcohol dehydrogenase family)